MKVCQTEQQWTLVIIIVEKGGREGHTEVEIVFFPSVARIRHLYSMGSPAVLNLFLLTFDFMDAIEKQPQKKRKKEKCK